jgi:hypothetical protein
MIVPKSIQSLKYPDFIRNHHIISDKSIPEKIFPSIGLENSNKAFKLKSSIDIKSELEIYLKDEIYPLLVSVSRKLSKSIEYRSKNYLFYANSDNKECKSRIDTIIKLIKINPSLFVQKSNNKYNLVIPNIGCLFTELKKIQQKYINTINLDEFENIEIDSFNDLIALQQSNLKISFSSSGNKGAWDIATMSMRGIESCQNWDSPHRVALIGSLLDPYAGVIYISRNNDYKGYGPTMIRRSVVRYVINRKTMKPAILLERIYPFHYESRMAQHLTLASFTNYIEEKTKGKFEIQYGEFRGTKKYSIPLTNTVKELKHDERSYRDSNIGYRIFKNI